MNPSQWDSAVSKIADLWGPSPKWANARVAVFDHARNLNYRKTVDVIDAIFDDGRPHAPSPSEVISAARTAGALDTPPAEDCRHTNWAVLTWHADGSAASGICAGCRIERTWPPNTIRTPGDIDTMKPSASNLAVPA
jgi:hypothetical protein